MLQIRCQNCSWHFTLGRDAIAEIMEEIKDVKTSHYQLDCPKCRHTIKVQTRQLKRYYRPAPEKTEEAASS